MKLGSFADHLFLAEIINGPFILHSQRISVTVTTAAVAVRVLCVIHCVLHTKLNKASEFYDFNLKNLSKHYNQITLSPCGGQVHLVILSGRMGSDIITWFSQDCKGLSCAVMWHYIELDPNRSHRPFPPHQHHRASKTACSPQSMTQIYIHLHTNLMDLYLDQTWPAHGHSPAFQTRTYSHRLTADNKSQHVIK